MIFDVLDFGEWEFQENRCMTKCFTTTGFSDEDPGIVAELVSFFNGPDRLSDLRASERVAQVSLESSADAQW